MLLKPDDLWLFTAGLLASSVNAAAGGGTLLSFPALLAAGLSPLAANATSTVGLVPGYLASLVGYRVEVSGELRRDIGRTVVPSLLGGVLGAWLLLSMGAAFFARIVPALLIGASALLLAQPLVARAFDRHRVKFDHPAALFGANFVVALYGGYFGAGAGILFLATMGLLLPRDLRAVNAIKVFVSLLANVMAAVTLIVMEVRHPTGALAFRKAAILALGAIVGGYVGVRLVRKLPPAALRGFAACVGLSIAVYFVYDAARNKDPASAVLKKPLTPPEAP